MSAHFFILGPTVDSFLPTDRLVQHFAHFHNRNAHTSITTEQLSDRVHPTGSETKYHVFNNQITDHVDIYHTTLKTKRVLRSIQKKHKGTYRNYSYTTSDCLSFLLAYATGTFLPFSSCKTIAPIPRSDASTWSVNGFKISTIFNMGLLTNAFLN